MSSGKAPGPDLAYPEKYMEVFRESVTLSPRDVLMNHL